MCLLIESIRLKNNKLINIPLHNERMDRSRRELFGCDDTINLLDIIHLEKEYQGLHKVRVTYDKIIHKIEIDPYQRRKVIKLKIVTDNNIDYTYKYADKTMLTKHLTEEGYDVLISKNGKITDTSFSNVALFDGKFWYTPAHPLLKGTMRSFLINNGKIIENVILTTDLKKFSKIRLINAFNGFEEPFELDVEADIEL